MKTFILLVALYLYPALGFSGDFSAIHSIKGVVKVEYHEPFLLVGTNTLSGLKRISEEVQTVIEEKSDPDVTALGNGFNLRVYELSVFKIHLKEQRLVESADTADELGKILKTSNFTTIVALDWSQENPIANKDRIIRKGHPPSPKNISVSNDNIKMKIDALKATSDRPEMFICFTMLCVGTLFYTVTDGQIHALQKTFPFADFEKRLPVAK